MQVDEPGPDLLSGGGRPQHNDFVATDLSREASRLNPVFAPNREGR